MAEKMTTFMQENLTTQERDTALQMISEALGPSGEIVFAASTGSRAFGWGGSLYDRDIRCAYHHGGIYWNYAHIGENGYDINADSLRSVLKNMRWRWTTYEDLSKPIYIDDRFDFEGFHSFCSCDQVKAQRHTTNLELERLRSGDMSPERKLRKALHCYRQLMCPTHFLETGEMEINVVEINKAKNMEQFTILADLYRERKLPFPEVDWAAIWRELGELEEHLEATILEHPTTVDEEALEKWQREMLSQFD